MTTTRWYARPEGEGLTLGKGPLLASWNRNDDRDQLLLREYLDDTAELLAPAMISGPWSLRLDVGLPAGRNLIESADLDNYALPLARHIRDERLVSVSCTKRHADNPPGQLCGRVLVAPAKEMLAPKTTHCVRTTASTDTKAYKEQVRDAVAGATEIPAGPVQLQISFLVGPRRNWLNLWKPTIDALDPLLGRTRADRDWHPKDGRITDLGLHVDVDAALGNDVVVTIAAGPALT